MFKPPLEKKDILQETKELINGDNYLIVFTDTIEDLDIG
jgi:hypothetical protein